MKTKLISLKNSTLLAGLLMITTSGFASDFKLGYVNVDRIFADAKPAKEIHEALNKKYMPEQNALKNEQAQLMKEQQQMQQIASKASSFDKLPKTEQQKLKELDAKYRKENTEFQQKAYVFQQNLQQSQELGLSLLMTKTNAILKDISDKEDFDLVLTSNQLVYAKAKYDLSDLVIAKLNNVDASDIIKKINSANPNQLPAIKQPIVGAAQK